MNNTILAATNNIAELKERIKQLEDEKEILLTLIREAELDDWFVQSNPDFDKRWRKALEGK